jgi:hypothetical protein
MNFILKHWYGQYPLAISFWLFFLFLGIAVHLFGFALLEQVSDTGNLSAGTMTAYQLTSGIILFPWQAIGLLRSAERHYREFGRPIILHSVQAIVLMCLIGITSHFIGLVQTLIVDQSYAKYKLKVGLPQYSIQITNDEKQLFLRGTLDFGVTKAVSLVLETHPDIKQVVLESEGGQVYEGRGLARLFHQFGVDTFSDSHCLSSCATAFIGGKKRYLSAAASLGFHQYAFDSTQPQTFQAFYNLGSEQNKDLELYRSKNIEEGFIQKMFHKPNHEIWYPSQEELLKAGVVTEILDLNAPKALENN